MIHSRHENTSDVSDVSFDTFYNIDRLLLGNRRVDYSLGKSRVSSRAYPPRGDARVACTVINKINNSDSQFKYEISICLCNSFSFFLFLSFLPYTRISLFLFLLNPRFRIYHKNIYRNVHDTC